MKNRLTIDDRLSINGNRLTIDSDISEWTPENKGAYLWHDFSDISSIILSGSKISQVSDKSTNNINVEQNDNTHMPELQSGSLNTLSTAYFKSLDSNQLYITTDNFNHNNIYDVSILIVSKQTSQTSPYSSLLSYNTSTGVTWQIDDISNNGRFNTRIGNTKLKLSTNDILDKWGIIRLDINYSGNSLKTYYNGSEQYNTTIRRTMPYSGITFRYGANRNNSKFIEANIAEVLFIPFNYRLKCEGYLAWKWGLTNLLPNNHFYKNEKPI